MATVTGTPSPASISLGTHGPCLSVVGSSPRRAVGGGAGAPVLRSPRTRRATFNARATTIGGVQDKRIRFRDQTLDVFIGHLASAEPVPGGGSTSAVVASFAAGLVTMVAALSEGRPRYAAHAAAHARARAAGEELANRLLGLADDDAAAYAGFSVALKLPRDTPDEQARRSAALRAAARAAAEEPLLCVQACLEVVAAAELLAGRSNVNASSDLTVAALLAEAAARGAAANVMVNLGPAGDDAWAQAMAARTDGLMKRIALISAATQAIVASGETRPPAA